MFLRILSEDNDYTQALNVSGSRFNGYLLNNNPITFSPREYVLEIESLPYTYNKKHPKYKLWTQFLSENPHIISNFDTQDPVKLELLFERWQIIHNNG